MMAQGTEAFKTAIFVNNSLTKEGYGIQYCIK